MSTTNKTTAVDEEGISFAQLLEETQAIQEIRPGEVIQAEVIRMDSNFVVVNAGLKSEAHIPIEEFYDDADQANVQVGDTVEVAIEQLENGFGETKLSREKAHRIAAWNFLETALN